MHIEDFPHLDQNDQHFNLDSLLSDQGEITAAFITTFLNGRDFKGMKCVGLKELSSVGLKLIGLISAHFLWMHSSES